VPLADVLEHPVRLLRHVIDLALEASAAPDVEGRPLLAVGRGRDRIDDVDDPPVEVERAEEHSPGLLGELRLADRREAVDEHRVGRDRPAPEAVPDRRRGLEVDSTDVPFGIGPPDGDACGLGRYGIPHGAATRCGVQRHKLMGDLARDVATGQAVADPVVGPDQVTRERLIASDGPVILHLERVEREASPVVFGKEDDVFA
jgi:hypothetical protein